MRRRTERDIPGGSGLPVVLADASGEALGRAADMAERAGAKVTLWQVDFEREGEDPLNRKTFRAIPVFRYVYRPLIASIKRAIRWGESSFTRPIRLNSRGYESPPIPIFC